MSAYYDLYQTPDPLGENRNEPRLHARILPRGTISADKFRELRLSQNEMAFFVSAKKIGQVLTSRSQNLPVSLIFCILGNQVKISQR